MLEPIGVTSSQADFLYHLKAGQRHPSAIAQIIGADPSNLSRMIRLFEQRGWLERRVDDTNRTRVELTLTPDGLAIAEKIDPHADFIDQTFRQHLSEAELEAFIQAIGTMREALAATPTDGWMDSKGQS